MSLKLRRFALGGVALCAVYGAGPAFAADATQIADALVAAFTAQGDSQASYDSASAAGDDVSIVNLKVTGVEGESVTVPTVFITNAQPRDPGGFTASSMSFDNATMLSEGNTITWGSASATETTVPSPDEIKSKAKIRPFASMDIADMKISGGDLPVPLEIASIGVALDLDEGGLPRDFALNVASINIPPELIATAEGDFRQLVEGLGYESFVVNILIEGGYETGSDRLTLRNFAIDAPDVGKFSLAGTISGVKASDLADDQSPDALANGKLENLTIRFDNAGVVERALDMQAKMMGASREDVVAQLNGALPFMLNAINNPAFQEKVAKAGSAFLTDPKSLTITVSPAEPVAFQEIMGNVMSAPQTLPDMLSIDVTANN
ncbi:MAG TPA: hypothetical protein VFK86_10390 [Bauldia sp.]|nr:hypothetical protein [Bauldia sp.]